MMDPHTKMIVLDDDPTGIQTVHGCLFLTAWDEEHLREAFLDDVPFFYVLTNTRAMTSREAAETVRSAMRAVLATNRSFGYRLLIVSRSDSCLRGHFPLETDVMRQVLAEEGIAVWPKVPFCPALIEAGRVTKDGIHYMISDGRLIPVAETEFAHDNVFGYHTSVLRDYIIEKGGRPDDYDIVSADSYDALNSYARQLQAATADFEGAVVIRCSSSLPRALSGIADQALLDRRIVSDPAAGPGCFVVGSHVHKTTRQLDRLLATEGTFGVEISVDRLLREPGLLMPEVLSAVSGAALRGLVPVIFTSRKEVRLDDADLRQQLGQRVSDFLVDTVRRLPFTPAWLIAKGGITSHDILTRGLEVRSARVLGQIISGVPCVMAPHFPYVIFPGNVGDDDALRTVCLKLAN